MSKGKGVYFRQRKESSQDSKTGWSGKLREPHVVSAQKAKVIVMW